MSEEEVLVVPASLLDRFGPDRFQGMLSFVREEDVEEIIGPANCRFMSREQAEQDPAYKQLIPYVIVLHGDPPPTLSPMVFQYVRGQGQGEKRLHGRCSIGIGGHINKEDAGGPYLSPYYNGLHRELLEELILFQPPERLTLEGLVNDDSTEVGRVHLGVVHTAVILGGRAWAREDSLGESGFCPAQRLFERFEELEVWSQMCLAGLFGQLAPKEELCPDTLSTPE